MNQRQALKAASKHIEDLTDSIVRYKWDMQQYNQVIEAMIQGKSPCPWCEDHEECQLEAKDGAGCAEWMLKWPGKAELEAAKKIEEDKSTVVEGR